MNSPQLRRQWLAEHPDFVGLMAQTHIPQKYFQMKYYRSTYFLEDELVYGLVVRARAGVVCLIQPLTAMDSLGNPFMPYRPEDADTMIFAYATYREPGLLGPYRLLEAGQMVAETYLCQKKDVPL